MDVRHLKSFVEAVKHVFATMLGTDILVGKPFLQRGEASPSGISAIIAFSGDSAGILALSFSEQVANKIAASFQGADNSDGDPDVADAVGELANVVAGQAKARI